MTDRSATGRSTYVDANGLRLHCVEWGRADAPPIILLHGLRAYGHWFDEFADAAELGYRLIAPDQRGRGASAWATDGIYDTDAYVADLEALADAFSLGRFILAGHSMGGQNAIAYAARHPDRVAALLILETAPELDPSGLSRIRREVAETPDSFESWEAARAFLRRLHPKPSERNIDTRLRWMLEANSAGKIVWRIDRAIFGPKRTPDSPARNWALLAQIKCPTLIMRGAGSDIVAPEIVERMLGTIPGSRAVEIPDAGHMVLEDNPTAFNQAVMAFLREVGG